MTTLAPLSANPRPTAKRRALVLGIRSAFQHGLTASSSIEVPPATRSKVFARDDFSCVYCGFKSKRFQEIRSLNPNGTGRPNQADDWVTCCHMCDQCQSLERVGMMGEGVLIWLPEMTQADLNHTLRALYVARSVEGEIADAAKRGIDALRARRDEAKRRIGSDDPMILATTFADHLTEAEYDSRAAKLDGIRLLSLDRKIVRSQAGEVDRFADMLTYWKSKEGAFGQTPPANWKALIDRLAD